MKLHRYPNKKATTTGRHLKNIDGNHVLARQAKDSLAIGALRRGRDF
jgi:hypothetical protein